MPDIIENTSIDPASVIVADRLRAVDAAWVEAIAASIQQKGQDTPIKVRRNGGGVLHLVAGAHRLEACRRLGVQIRAEIIACSELEARLIEIDENLFRHELGALDRAVFLAERRAIYLEMHPETKKGGKNQHTSVLSDTMSFSKDVEARTGMTARTVERAILIATKIPADVRARLVGTPLADRQVDLLALAGLSPEQQRQVVALITGGGAKTLKAAIAIVDGTTEPDSDPDDRQYHALMKCWGNASPAAKSRFLADLRLNGELEE